MTPVPGERRLRFVGDRVCFTLRDRGGHSPPSGWRARLRTNLGRADTLRREILQAHTRSLPLGGESWRDVPMLEDAQGWSLELPLTEVGYFKAKAYLVDPRGWQHWPEGPDVGICVHPNRFRAANIIYCAFTRMFGDTRRALGTSDESLGPALKSLDSGGYTVIPPSGKLRDLIKFVPHICKTLGCRILHLLPVHPTPTTYARFGRFGSPYAALDLTAIDPALVVLDKRTTAIDQFRELTYATHLHGGCVFLDIVINHTGWGSVLQESHPEWFLRQADGAFISPGAWGVTWEDLVELSHTSVALWDELAEVFLTWCRRGVDGFRCDAGYKVPVPAWQYIVTRVQQEYPETVFLLEGLGGAWDATEALLTEGGMQWAYSELFQNFSGAQIAGYLDHSLRQCHRVGLLIHYSETHDNERLAAKGKAWSLLRNRLCALTSISGGFGFTCGVEWLASEKIRVHGSTGMAWDNPDNLVPELAKLSQLLAEHPCFFDGARCVRLTGPESPVYALLRQSEEGKDTVLVLVNTEPDRANMLELDYQQLRATLALGLQDQASGQNQQSPGHGSVLTELSGWVDLLEQAPPVSNNGASGKWTCTLAPGGAYCLAPTDLPRGLHGESYRRARAQAAWGLTALSRLIPAEQIGNLNWRILATQVERSPARFLAAISQLAHQAAAIGLRGPSHGGDRTGKLAEKTSAPDQPLTQQSGSAAVHELPGRRPVLPDVLLRLADREIYPPVVTWTLLDLSRIALVPPGHWLLLQDTVPFRAALVLKDDGATQNVESISVQGGHVACFAPRPTAAEGLIRLERYAQDARHVEGVVFFLAPVPELPGSERTRPRPRDLVLLTNGRGGMARICVDLGRVLSKYDCVLGANLHPNLPVDRHIFAKRIRVWINADGFISPLDLRGLASFEAGPPAVWSFLANAGDGRTVEVRMTAAMLEAQNTTVFRFSRPTAAQATGKQLPAQAEVRLTVRVDIEDRNFHWETKRNGGADYHFSSHLHRYDSEPQAGPDTGIGRNVGFAFTPAPDRTLRVFADAGFYYPQPEWSENIPHAVEQSRGQVGSGDAFSPGWFDLPLAKGATVTLTVTAEPRDPRKEDLDVGKSRAQANAVGRATNVDGFFNQLLRAVQAFVVRRGTGKTVIAGYPWFLDWGRDTFICARGLVAAGMTDEVKELVVTFARFEKDGTLPNTICGDDASNRDTSDAPLWFGLVCEELSRVIGPIGSTPVGGGRSLGAVLESIALNYSRGTPNGIRMDPDSALIWSPSHFTWMDTNYPACTPREGYPVEIQALWIRLLRLLAEVGSTERREGWARLAARAFASLNTLFWLEERGYYADVLLAPSGQSAASAAADDALRSNCLFLISLGLAQGEPARRCVDAALRYLVVPGALRSLAPLPVSTPLPNYGQHGRLLNNPRQPYWGRYEGDEDTRRKPAYHNGTAWLWTFPAFCESLALAWDLAPEPIAAARAYLGSVARVMAEGCIGQLPEILDGDVPHSHRGCDAQAWSATEALRVWKFLSERGSEGG